MFERPISANGRSTKSIVLSVTIHGGLVISLFAMRYTVQSVMEPRNNLRVTLLAPTAVPLPKYAPVRAPVLKAPAIQTAAKFTAPKTPTLAPPLLEPPLLEPPMEQPVLKTPPVTPVVAAAAPAPFQPRPVVIQTGVFSIAPVAKASPTPPREVQTGGFSSASSGSTQPGVARQAVAAGFGDAGTPPAPGARRGVATGAGFGDAGVSSGTGNSQRSIRAGGFGDAVSVAATTGAGRQMEVSARATAAQILEKPRPAYTEEARRLQIEGEVQLEVQFRASGEVYIVRVVRGLGHGLDENAAQAARTIRFLPAKRDGRPVDSTATVHIIFQLAS